MRGLLYGLVSGLILLVCVGSAGSAETDIYLCGDVTGDGALNVMDVVASVGVIVGQTDPSTLTCGGADTTQDVCPADGGCASDADCGVGMGCAEGQCQLDVTGEAPPCLQEQNCTVAELCEGGVCVISQGLLELAISDAQQTLCEQSGMAYEGGKCVLTSGQCPTQVDECAACPGACVADVPPDVLVHAHFQDQVLGTYSQAQVPEDFEAVPTWNDGLDEGRVTIVDEDGQRFMRVRYPAGGVGTALGGTQFKVPLPGSYEALTISYRVRFGEGFDFVKGGKLPGLCGGDCNTGGDVPDGTDGFSARMMWRADGAVTQYMYMPDQASQWGDDLYWDEGGQRLFAPGAWHQVQTHIVMNTPGESDGVVQSWFDGELALSRSDIRLRDVPTLALDTVYFSTFFGGSGDAWAPTADEVVDFDDLVVSAGPIPICP